jgi:hypothetical protein
MQKKLVQQNDVSRLLHVLCGRLQSRRSEQFVRIRMVPRPLLDVSEGALLLRRRCDDECGALLFDIAGTAHAPTARASLPQRTQRACHTRTAFKGRDTMTSTHRCEGIALRIRVHRNVGCPRKHRAQKTEKEKSVSEQGEARSADGQQQCSYLREYH